MKECISIKTDYSLLESTIQIKDLLSYAVENSYKTLGIIDDNLSGTMEFLNGCQKNNIKPVVGYDITINNKQIILYAKDSLGLKKLFKLNTYLLDNDADIVSLTKCLKDLIVLIPYSSIELYEEITKICSDVFIGVKNDSEKKSALLLTKNVIPFNIVLSLTKENTKYLNYLEAIKSGALLSEMEHQDYSESYLKSDDLSSITNLIEIKIEKEKNLIPHYDEDIKDSYKYLESLSMKGLSKRLNGDIPSEYKERLIKELKIINSMGYTDYFLIVYDYVKYAIKNNILVGPGRGSAAGSLVTYSLGITSVDPLRYGLLFERFLNPERVTLPDIDIDFDAEKRNQVIDYVKTRYGQDKALGILAYGTFASKQVLISLAKIFDKDISNLLKLIDPKKTLRENLTDNIKKILNTDLETKQLYYDALKLEGLKKHISTHAAGIVISSKSLDEIIPVVKSGTAYLTGYTMNYLEDLGLLKMDFLAIKDLTTISDILKYTDDSFNIKEINLEDEKVLNRFCLASTTGIFQFESEGMKNFLRKSKPTKFTDIVVALALFRPGPMQNIDSFINRKDGKEPVDYLVPALEPVLKETYGIIVYQEQIMQIFNIIAGYTVAEADLIRRAISKKKEDIIRGEEEKFVKKAVANNYSDAKAKEIYNLIMKFANYGFNKSHSVAYALVGYQMMYLKVYYEEYFYISLLNINIGSSSKTKEYIDEAKNLDIKILKPDINKSMDVYIKEDGIRMPLNSIKNIGDAASKEIILERQKGDYIDFFDFVSRVYGKSVNNKTIEHLIYGGALDSFKERRGTLLKNINSALIYAELTSGLDSSLVAKPSLETAPEIAPDELMNKELELFGFYVSNHPASKYKETKLSTIANHFDKVITTVGLLESMKTIKTKNNDSMAFLKVSDETGSLDYVLFPNKIDYANRIKKGDLLKIIGKVEKRLDKYQIVVNTITHIQTPNEKQ